MSKLYIVATPIGNLGDISQRALGVLGGVDLIVCEDTRVTQKLLARYKIKKQLLSYYQHSKLTKIEQIISLLDSGKDIALVTDAGTPGISDPGGKLINLAIEQLNNLTIIPIPGPSALTTALSISGLPADRFLFLGFLPHKKGRQKFLEEVAKTKYTVVFYESTHRIFKTLNQLKEILSGTRSVVVCRELTKKFETIYRGNVDEVIRKIREDEIKGEFVIIVAPLKYL